MVVPALCAPLGVWPSCGAALYGHRQLIDNFLLWVPLWGKSRSREHWPLGLATYTRKKNSILSTEDLWIYPSSSPFSHNIVLRLNQKTRNLYILLITTNYEKLWQHIYQPQSILRCLLSQATPIRMLYCPDWTTFLGLLLWGARSCLLSWAWLPVALDFIPCVGGIASEE